MSGQSDAHHEAIDGRLSDDDLRKLLEVGRALVAELDGEAVLHRVLETARELTGAHYAALGILDEAKEELERFIFVGIDEETRRVIGPLPRGGGVLGEMIRNPQPLRLKDVTRHPRSYGFPPGHPPMTTFLGVPVIVRGEAFGNLYLTDKADGAQFDARDEQATLVLAEWAAIAIGNARLYEDLARRGAELERAVRGLEATAAVARAVGFETDLERVLELIVKRGRALVDARSLVVLLEDGDGLCVAAAAGEIGADAIGTRLPLEGTVAGAVVASGDAQRVARLGDRVGHGLDALAAGAASALVVPLGFRHRARGVLVALDSLGSSPEFASDQQHLLTSFGASAAIAIATAQSVEEVRLTQSIRAYEAERTRWARELHDETLQELGALKLMLDAARRSQRPEAIAEAADGALEQLSASIAGLQGLITDLRPAALDELGVQPAVEALVRRVSERHGITVNTKIDLEFVRGRDSTRLVPEIESTAYRLVQEALTNTVKHAEAEAVWVEIVEDEQRVTLSVRDDGQGFDAHNAHSGFGLVGMRERVELVEGRLLIDSKPGEGTLVRAELPARHRPGHDSVESDPVSMGG